MAVRRPVWAGTLYPGDGGELARLLGELYEGARASCVERFGGRVAGAVLVPHGELGVAGPVALAGLSCIPRDRFDTFVVVGPNHSGLGLPVAGYPGGSWATPLGETRVDGEFSALLARLDEFLELDEEAHRDEYSVETVLVLLQYLFGTDIRFVPIVVSDATAEAARSLARSIHDAARTLGRRVVLVATTNIGLEPSREEVEQTLDQVLEPLLGNKPDEFYALLEARGITLCNPAVAATPLYYAELSGLARGVLIARRVAKAPLDGGYTGYASIAWPQA